MGDTLLAIAAGLAAVMLIFVVLRVVPTNEPEDDPEDDELEDGVEGDTLAYDPAAPDPWEGELGATKPQRDIETLIAVLRQGEPGPCRDAVYELVSHGEEAVPALRAAAADGDPDLKIDAERAIALIEEDAGT